MPDAFSTPSSLASLAMSGSFISLSMRMSSVSAACRLVGARRLRDPSPGSRPPRSRRRRCHRGGAGLRRQRQALPPLAGRGRPPQGAAGSPVRQFRFFGSGGLRPSPLSCAACGRASLPVELLPLLPSLRFRFPVLPCWCFPHRRENISRLISSIPFFVTTERR